MKQHLRWIWHSMIGRCTNPERPQYHNYGGRGISVCERWSRSFESFYDWSIENDYEIGLSIDRIDNDKGYSPDNCRWVTMKEQNNNTRSNRIITFEGKTQTMAEWADEVGIKYACLEARINRLGWSLERALS